jgi:thiol-disulfide isomerase/thioredoxin
MGIFLVGHMATATVAGEVNWFEGGLPKALKVAKAQKRFVMVDVFAEWCGPCKQMDKTVWKDAKVIKALDELKLVPVKVDGDRMPGAEELKRYRVNSFPTLLFLDAEGNEVGRMVGYNSAGDYAALLKKALRDTRPEKELRAVLEKNPGDAAALFTLSQRLRFDDREATRKERLSLLDRAFQADSDNAKEVGAQALVDRVSMALAAVGSLSYMKEIVAGADASSWIFGFAWGDSQNPEIPAKWSAVKKAAEDFFRSLDRDLSSQLVVAARAAGSFKSPDANPEALFEMSMRMPGTVAPLPETEIAANDLAALVSNDPEVLNNVAFSNYQKQRNLPESEAMIRRALAASAGNANAMDTLAHVLYSLGKKEEALKVQREAVAAAKKANAPNVQQLEESLKSLEAGILDQLDKGVVPVSL